MDRSPFRAPAWARATAGRRGATGRGADRGAECPGQGAAMQDGEHGGRGVGGPARVRRRPGRAGRVRGGGWGGGWGWGGGRPRAKSPRARRGRRRSSAGAGAGAGALSPARTPTTSCHSRRWRCGPRLRRHRGTGTGTSRGGQVVAQAAADPLEREHAAALQVPEEQDACRVQGGRRGRRRAKSDPPRGHGGERGREGSRRRLAPCHVRDALRHQGPRQVCVAGQVDPVPQGRLVAGL